MRLGGVTVLVMGLALSGCATDPALPSLTGQWAGASSTHGYDCTFTESGGLVTGSCQETPTGAGPIGLTVGGSRSGSSVTLTLVGTGRNLTFVGSMSTTGSQISGTITPGSAVTLARQ